jgi:hypothetical protein
MNHDFIRLSFSDNEGIILKDIYLSKESDNEKAIRELLGFFDSKLKQTIEYTLIVDYYKKEK